MNGNRGLKRLAEEGNESLHSVQRRARAWGSRKVTLTAGDEDTFRYLKLHKMYSMLCKMNDFCFYKCFLLLQITDFLLS